MNKPEKAKKFTSWCAIIEYTIFSVFFDTYIQMNPIKAAPPTRFAAPPWYSIGKNRNAKWKIENIIVEIIRNRFESEYFDNSKPRQKISSKKPLKREISNTIMKIRMNLMD